MLGSVLGPLYFGNLPYLCKGNGRILLLNIQASRVPWVFCMASTRKSAQT